MSYIIVDLPGDPVALPECGGVDLIVLLFQQSPVFLCQEQIMFLAVILSAAQFRLKRFTVSCIALEKKRGQ